MRSERSSKENAGIQSVSDGGGLCLSSLHRTVSDNMAVDDRDIVQASRTKELEAMFIYGEEYQHLCCRDGRLSV